MRMKVISTIIFLLLAVVWALLTLTTPFPSPEVARVGPLWEMQSEWLFLLGCLGTGTTFFSFVFIRQLYGKIESLEQAGVSVSHSLEYLNDEMKKREGQPTSKAT